MLLQQLINGFVIGSIYALVTIGFNMVFGVLGITNFAHSSFYMLAAYFTQYLLTFMTSLTSPILGLTISMLISILLVGILSIEMHRYTLKPIQKKNADFISMIVATIGVQTIINNCILLFFGPAPQRLDTNFASRVYDLGGKVIVREIQIYIAIVTIVTMLLLNLFVKKHKWGKAVRAISQDITAARIVGINIDFIVKITFFIGTTLAGVAGIISALYYQRIDPLMASSVSLKSFAAAVLGGLGSVPGAFLGGYIIGVLETLFAGYVDAGLKDIVAFILLIVVLMIRPTGIFGKRKIDKV